MELHYLSIAELHRLLTTRQISAVELAQATLERIERIDPSLKSFLTLSADLALEQAAAADERLHKGESVTPLTGIPFGVKDAIITRGVRTTCGSKILDNYIPPYDATVISRLTQAGAVLIGKTNMDEFGMGSSTENSAFFDTHNPWDLGRVPGGSSGGSAAAVAAGLVPFCLGGDTGGSIRTPAAFCGIAGLKPTYGRVSRYGLIALASSFDTIGPLARDAHDAALVLETIAGHDPYDSTSLVADVSPYSQSQRTDLKGMKIGVPREYFAEGMAADVKDAITAAIEQMQALGATVGEVSLPHTPYAIPVYYLILFAEVSANLSRYDGVRYGLSLPERAGHIRETYLASRGAGLGDEVKRRILLGALALSADLYDEYYLQAERVRTLIKRDFAEAFQTFDALVTPISPTPAFKLGEKVADPIQMYLSDIYTVPINPAGIPALTIPCGIADGLPVGMQLLGPNLSEARLFDIAHAYQSVTQWHTHRPPIDELVAGQGAQARA